MKIGTVFTWDVGKYEQPPLANIVNMTSNLGWKLWEIGHSVGECIVAPTMEMAVITYYLHFKKEYEENPNMFFPEIFEWKPSE